jgi:hypothetical protein
MRITTDVGMFGTYCLYLPNIENAQQEFDQTLSLQVISQDPEALWHSGRPGENEDGCPDLPLCPADWPYDKNQWLAYDMGTCYSVSGFRTRHPSFEYWRVCIRVARGVRMCMYVS